MLGGTVAQAAALTIYRLECPWGRGFGSDPLSFPDPTPHLFSPSHFLSKPSLSYLIKGQKPKNLNKTNCQSLQVENNSTDSADIDVNQGLCVCVCVCVCVRSCVCVEGRHAASHSLP